MSTREYEDRPLFFPWRLTVLAAAAAGLLAACSDADTPGTVSVRDSAGVRIVEHDSLPDGLPTVRVDGPITDIGGASADEGAQLHQVQGAVRLSSGQIVVANGGSSELRFFDPDGSHLRTVAGSGDGPGEFQRLRGLVRVPGDSLIAYGAFGARTSLFAPDGEHVQQLRMDLEDPTSVTPRGRISDGRWIVSVLTSDLSSTSLESGVHWPEGLLDDIDDPQMRRRFQEALDELTYPERVPVVTNVKATPEGVVWVRGHAPPDAEEEPAWWGFDADGGFIGRMELPMTVYDLRDGVAVGRHTDELDVQHVQLFRYEVGG